LRIVLSAGHGPYTPGKRAPDGFREFWFTFPTAELVAKYLSEYLNVSTMKVYEKERDVPLGERTRKANSWGADLYVSIHGNAYGSTWTDAHGIETLVFSKSSSGYKAAQKVQDSLIKATKLTNRGIKIRPDLWEMRKTNMAALLCECGFYTNSFEKKLMESEAYQSLVARAIVSGIAEHYGLKKKPTEAKPPTTPKAPASTPSGGGMYRVQIGAFAVFRNAQELEKAAKDRGFSPFVKKEGNLYKVQVGAFSSKANAEKFLKVCKEKGFKTAFIDK